MANQHSGQGSGSSDIPADSSDSMVQLNIKTLESRIHSFQVDKNMLVSSFKEKIAYDIGVPVLQQRLIFRGKVLKDDHPLSEYHVENGHTLHLVARQPAQSQDSSGTNAGEANTNTGHQGNDPNAGGPRGRIGQISHSVVLGSFNVGDQGEGIAPDISRVIGAVLNSIGVGNQNMPNMTGGFPSANMSNNPGSGTEGFHLNAGPQGIPFPSLSQTAQSPFAAAALPIPTVTTPISSSLTTISEFINRMEQTLSQNDNSSNTSPNSIEDLPSNAQGLHTPEALGIVLRQAERLLSGHTVASLSHIAGRLEQERESSDPVIRGQIQAESTRIGLAVQHLGALFLELGRAMLTFRMGQTPVESVVNSGPAVYISPSGPNPIMAQPFPLQTNSLFSGSASPFNPMTFGPVAVGNGPRNVNIHIHAGSAVAPMVTAIGTRPTNGDGSTGTGAADSAAARVFSVRNIIASTVPPRSSPPGSGVSTSGVLVSQPPSNSTSQLGSTQGVNTVQSGQSQSNVQNQTRSSVSRDVETERHTTSTPADGESSVSLPGYAPKESCKLTGDLSGSKGDSTCSDKENSSYKKQDTKEEAKTIPLGLGLGGLERKRRVKQQIPPVQSSDVGTSSSSSDQNQLTRSNGQYVRNSGPSAGQGDMASVMSQVLQSPALNGLLSGVSEQTGVGSPDVLRNMLQQFTQNPQMRNIVNQISEQVDTQEVENMFSGMGGPGGGGGIDLSRMFQQMMPIVTRALGAPGPGPAQPLPGMESISRPSHSWNDSIGSENIYQSLQRIGGIDAPEGVFRALAEDSFQLSGTENQPDGLVDELCSDEDLVNEYVDLLQDEIRRRFRGELDR